MKRLVWNRHTKLLLKHVAGWLCIALGLIMLITPGQGILTLLIGISLLADHVPAFGRLRDRLNARFPKTADFIHRKGEALRRRGPRSEDEGRRTEDGGPKTGDG